MWPIYRGDRPTQVSVKAAVPPYMCTCMLTLNFLALDAFSQDMTSRELLQQRTTLPNGDTAWRESPLILAAREGSIAVLDGVHRLESSTLSALQR